MSELRQHERLQLTRRERRRRFGGGAAVGGGAARTRSAVASCLAMLIVLLALPGCVTIDVFGDSADAPLEESVVRGERGPKILLIEIDGVIGGDAIEDTFFGTTGPSLVARVREELDRARKDDQVRAILLRIDSPGGSATASDQIYTELVRFREERSVPIVAQLLETAASGGYYVAMAADTVQAHPTTVTGSIGVIFTSLNFAGLMEKLGIEDQTLTAGVYKDAGSPFRRLTAVERVQLQSVVDDLHVRFREVVSQGRPELDVARVNELADGRIYSAPQALEMGLVDSIGSLEEAVVRLEERLGVSATRVVAYHRPREVRRNVYAQSRGGPGLSAAGSRLAQGGLGGVGLGALGPLLSRPGFHYLWWPGVSGLGSAR